MSSMHAQMDRVVENEKHIGRKAPNGTQYVQESLKANGMNAAIHDCVVTFIGPNGVRYRAIVERMED